MSFPAFAGAHVLAAHGTRKQTGVALVADLAERVSAELGSKVHVAFVDVLGPTPCEVLRNLDEPAVVVPAFSLAGTTSMPISRRTSSRADIATSSSPMRWDPARSSHGFLPIVRRMWLAPRKLGGAGGGRDVGCTCAVRPAACGGVVVGGDRRPGGTGLRCHRRTEGSRCGQPASPTGRTTGGRIVIPVGGGLFQDRLRNSGADAVADPLGAHPAMARLIANRFRRARLAVAA